MDTSVYSLRFEGCIEQANQAEPRKIAISIVNVTHHTVVDEKITITFADPISCQMARDILGDKDWQFISDTEIYGTLKKSLGYKIQHYYFRSLHINLCHKVS